MRGGAHDDDDNDDPSTIACLDNGIINFDRASVIELLRCDLLNCHWYLRLNPLTVR